MTAAIPSFMPSQSWLAVWLVGLVLGFFVLLGYLLGLKAVRSEEASLSEANNDPKTGEGGGGESLFFPRSNTNTHYLRKKLVQVARLFRSPTLQDRPAFAPRCQIRPFLCLRDLSECLRGSQYPLFLYSKAIATNGTQPHSIAETKKDTHDQDPQTDPPTTEQENCSVARRNRTTEKRACRQRR